MLMDGCGLENGDPLPAGVMVQRQEDEGLQPPAVLPPGVAMQEPGAPLIDPPGKKGLGVTESWVNTASLPSDSPQKRPLSSPSAVHDALQATAGPPPPVGGSTECLAADDSSCVPQTPPPKSDHVVPPVPGLPTTCDKVETPPPKSDHVVPPVPGLPATCDTVETPPPKSDHVVPPVPGLPATCDTVGTPPPKSDHVVLSATCDTVETPPPKSDHVVPPVPGLPATCDTVETPPPKSDHVVLPATCDTVETPPPKSDHVVLPATCDTVETPPPKNDHVVPPVSGLPATCDTVETPPQRNDHVVPPVPGLPATCDTVETPPPKSDHVVPPVPVLPGTCDTVETPPPKSDHVVPPVPCDTVGPPTPENSSPGANLTPAKVPKKRGRKSKAELQQLKAAQELMDPLVHPPGRNGLGVLQSSGDTAALPNDSNQKRALSPLPASQDTLLTTTVLPGTCDTVETPPPKSDHVVPPVPCDTVGPPTPENSSPGANLTPAKVPKKRGRKSKAELQQLKAAQELMDPLVHPPGRNGLGVLQSSGDTAALPNDSNQKRALSPLPASQDTLLTTTDAPPVDGGDKSLASEDPVTLPMPVKVPKKRGRKSKAEMLLIRMAKEAEAQKLEESRHSDSENVELELSRSGRPQRRAAKTALKNFQAIADEWAESGRSSPPKTEEKVPEENTKKRRRKRNLDDSDDDFVVSEQVLEEEEEAAVEDDSMSEEESDDDLSFFRRGVFAPGEKVLGNVKGTAENGLQNSIMAPVWAAAAITTDFREAHYSDWEYPEWVPQKDSWHFLSESEAEPYLPRQTTSPPFCIRREGLEEESEPRVLHRFQSLPPHPQRQDVTFYVGGPVWALDWCPTLWGSAPCQYVALYCHRGMDDRHRVDAAHTGPALLQLWRLGALSLDKGGDAAPAFSYGLAVEDGCMWDLKFCPSGGWEPPSTLRMGTEMARLGLLAVAFSSGHVQIYSLPHPEALQAHRRTQVKDPWDQTICKVDCVVKLHVGSIKASSPGENGQCFTLAWFPSKPHHYLAAGFYDGTVAIWDLKTRSVLQRVRQGRVIKQYPFHSFSAHDSAVNSIEWCKADSNFFVSCGRDRRLKFWDLRRLHTPVNSIKRFQSTEMAWLLPYCGVAVAQDNCYASQGFCGIHFVDSGFLGYKPYFATPRKGTVWSVSGSDWLSILASGDVTGEVLVTVLPSLNAQSINTKRPADRRFPVYKVDFLSCAPPSADSPDAGDHMLRGPLAESRHWDHFKPKSFRAAAGRFSLLLKDTDLTDFHGMSSREPGKRMQANEMTGDLNMERVQLEAIHKVRSNPNLDAYTWIVSGGHSGLVRVHCVRALLSSVGQKMLQERCTKFQALYEAAEMFGELEYSPEVQHCVVDV